MITEVCILCPLDLLYWLIFKKLLNQWRQPPIYYFYEEVPNNAAGETQDGDRHYHCLHGKKKIFPFTQKMRGFQTGKIWVNIMAISKWIQLPGLVGHLHTHFPAMFCLYEALKNCPENKLLIASGWVPFDSATVIEYLKTLKAKTGPIVDTFAKATAKSEVSYIANVTSF